ncbi:hypothetical protein VPNG_06808 [Cytospora leucostoma]|uniref:Uncharacterized protein n=1 Tax=Cytospora leucostoma TaxID=1230097 RepID=A0A423WVT4_9PEZI|nr:hypothetical protein VPNG_06808 [Cytospora leucostoma]
MRKELRESVALALRLEGQGNDAEQLKVDDVEASPAGMALQANVVSSFLFIADAEAFETEKLRLSFLDTRGNIVRETRVPCTETWLMRDGWNAKKFLDSEFWSDRDKNEWPLLNDPGSVLGEISEKERLAAIPHVGIPSVGLYHTFVTALMMVGVPVMYVLRSGLQTAGIRLGEGDTGAPAVAKQYSSIRL